MLSELVLAATVAAATPTPPPSDLPIKGVTVDRQMPDGVTHIEAPPLKGYRIQGMPYKAPAPTPTPRPRS